MQQSPEESRQTTLETLFQHNLWANTCLFDLCAELSAEQLSATTVGTFGTIGDTLAHLAGAEHSYLHRITTGQPYQRPDGAAPPTLADMQASVRASGAGLIVAAQEVGPQDSVTINWDGVPRSVPCAVILTQAINHATEHRAHIMTTLTQIGVEPPDIDSWSFFDDQDAATAD